MKVKYLLALALSHHAELLILDEPTSGLDPVSREELLHIFRQIVNRRCTQRWQSGASSRWKSSRPCARSAAACRAIPT